MKISSDIIWFVARVIIFFIVWYVIYELWLLPDGRLDKWLSLNIVSISHGVLELLNFDIISFGRVIAIKNNPGIEVINGCNGISAIGLFIGYISSYPGKLAHKSSYIVFGIFIIYITNILRIIFLTIAQEYWQDTFDFLHNYSTSTIFYIIIFMLWVIWTNYSSINSLDIRASKSV